MLLLLSTTEAAKAAATSGQRLLNYFSIKCQLNLDIMFYQSAEPLRTSHSSWFFSCWPVSDAHRNATKHVRHSEHSSISSWFSSGLSTTAAALFGQFAFINIC